MSSDHFLEYFSCDCAQGIPSVCTIDGSKALVFCKSAARQLVHCLMELGTNLFLFGDRATAKYASAVVLQFGISKSLVVFSGD